MNETCLWLSTLSTHVSIFCVTSNGFLKTAQSAFNVHFSFQAKRKKERKLRHCPPEWKSSPECLGTLKMPRLTSCFTFPWSFTNTGEISTNNYGWISAEDGRILLPSHLQIYNQRCHLRTNKLEFARGFFTIDSPWLCSADLTMVRLITILVSS